jgi:O-antigen ligase/tetratricopeptide (TPR) repeat protein
VALLCRTFSKQRPFLLPSRGWCGLAAVSAAVLLCSSALSPYRGTSLQAALMPLAALATFFVVHDWIHHSWETRARTLSRAIGFFSIAVVVVSLGRWVTVDLLNSKAILSFSSLFVYRNAQPLGHSNYTAGLALLTLPWLGLLVIKTRTVPGRIGWSVALLLALVMLFSSGSRGGMVGLAALAIVAIWQARLGKKQLVLAGLAAAAVALALAYAHPRTRTMLLGRVSTVDPLRTSTVQRSAMLSAGQQMGWDRPVLGWGPGTTPLVYPRYRAKLEGGAENVLQLHNTPIQIWADLGLLGAGCLVGFLVLVGRSGSRIRRRENYSTLRQGSAPYHEGDAAQHHGSASTNPAHGPVAVTAIITLVGYVAFALTDYQLDLPVFAFAVALFSALIAQPGNTEATKRARVSVQLTSLVALALVALLGRADPTPALNTQALSLAANSNSSDQAIALLRESLALNPDQEIAHFNLGWLLVVRDPAAAERHFLQAAHLVPDKGGVYFGLALARLNRGNRNADASDALALECLNDPLFLTSPWWREPAIAALRTSALSRFIELAERVASELDRRSDNRARDARYIVALAAWLEGRGALGEILARSQTSERVSYFAARPHVPEFNEAPVRSYRRVRSGYPVLMRKLDLTPPVDLFDVRETILFADELSFLFPAKGWLPSPLLVQLLDQSTRRK